MENSDKDYIPVSIESIPDLQNWKNAPTVADLKSDFEQAQSHHSEHVNDVTRWLDNLNVTGSAKRPKQAGRSSVTPKLIRKQAEWRYASLSEPFLSPENLFKLAPVTWEDKAAAEQAALVLNNQWNTKINKVKFIDDFVRTAVDEGTAIVRVGWEFQEEEVEVPVFEEQDPKDFQTAEILVQKATQVAEGAIPLESLEDPLRGDVEATMKNGRPTILVQTGTRKEKRTTKNHPTADVVDYESTIVDPNCKGDLSKAEFVIYAFTTSRSELEKSGIEYKNLEHIRTDGANAAVAKSDGHHNENPAFSFKDEPRKKFIAYEYWGFWDIDGSGVTKPIVATWVGDVMIRLEESPHPDGKLPFVLVQYLPKRKHVYGQPDGYLLEENQKIAGAVTRGMLDIMGRAAAGQKGVRKGALDVTNQRRFDRGQDYTFNGNVDPQMAFYTHTYPELPNSAQFILEQQNLEAESLTGVKAFHQGVSGEGLGRSATAARSAMDAAGKRELGILRRLSQGIIEIGRKHMALNAVFLDEEEVVRVTNDTFVPVKRDDLASKADITLDISTVETDNAKAEELSFMLQTMGNNLPFELTKTVMADIAKLRKMPELAHRLEEYEPQPDPVAQKRQELELAELEAKIEKLRSEAAENYAEAEKDKADAEKASSERDLNNLNFIEQETGTQHIRELDKLGAQAESNKDLEMTKAALNQAQRNIENNSANSEEGVEPAF